MMINKNGCHAMHSSHIFISAYYLPRVTTMSLTSLSLSAGMWLEGKLFAVEDDLLNAALHVIGIVEGHVELLRL